MASGLEAVENSDAVSESFISPEHHESNEHIALIYATREEQLGTAVPFIRQGLARGEKCLYVLDDNAKSVVVDAMASADIDVTARLQSGDLKFLTRESYVATESLVPDDQLDALSAAIENASAQYPHVRVAVEMTCFLEDDLTFDDLIDYEARYNSISEEVSATALCQYNRQRFPPEVIRDVIRTHPHLISDRTLSHNIHYIPPDRYFGSEDPNRAVEHMLSSTTELAEAEAELKRQNDRLEEFASIVSHDLRNPLRVAEGHVELAREKRDGEHIEAIADAHQRMDELIEDSLSFARTDAQADTIEPVDLNEIVTDCWELVPTADASFIVETDSRIVADADLLPQLIENLLRNAVEHGGKDVTVKVGRMNSGPGFYLEDDGPGIPVDKRTDVFDLGFSTRTEGIGFGLSIVRDIANAHGWQVSVSESAEGGARFEFTAVDIVE